MNTEIIYSKNLLDCSHTIARSLFESITYPWEALNGLSDYILTLGNKLDPNVYDKIGDDIWVAKSAKIAPTAYLHGPLIICENAEIRHCAFIRGCAIVGANAVVGNSTELKGSILFDNVQAPHYNYVGDSILGYKSHMGAGSITSNLKSDKTIVKIALNGERVDTGRKKLGAILGDMVEVGCNSVLNPGTIIGSNTNIYPLSMVRGYIPQNSIYKSSDKICKKLDITP